TTLRARARPGRESRGPCRLARGSGGGWEVEVVIRCSWKPRSLACGLALTWRRMIAKPQAMPYLIYINKLIQAQQHLAEIHNGLFARLCAIVGNERHHSHSLRIRRPARQGDQVSLLDGVGVGPALDARGQLLGGAA